MKPRPTCGSVAALCVAFCALTSSLGAQVTTAPRANGIAEDWSQHTIVFSRDALARRPDVLYREPRVLHQVMERWQAPEWGVLPEVEGSAGGSGEPLGISGKRVGPERDWNISLGSARMGQHVFPAKYSFDPAAPPDCINDYVLYGLSLPGTTAGQANLVAFNNLYVNGAGTGACAGTTPSVMFAYNISANGGKIATSPILSLDGTKAGFVESGTGAVPFSTFHVLTWTAGQGTVTSAAAPAAMLSVPLSATANCTTSAPWIDFANDTVYVADDSGILYKITGVFNGTPTLAASPWPLTIVAGNHLSPPVLDSVLGKLMVGAQNGNLYQIDVASGTVGTVPLPVGTGATTSGIVAPPVVDITNGTTFVVSANDGTSAVLVEADTATLTQITKAAIGKGSSGGTALRLYEPAFSNDYYSDPSTGVIRLCGTSSGDTSPWQYAFGFSGRTMNTSSSFSASLLTSTAARCTGWTEFFNPNVGVPPGTDYFFFGLTQDCTGTGTAFGCVAEITTGNTTPLTATVSGGPSGIVIDNYSTALGASSLYLSAEGANLAYKFTQVGLQ